MSSLQCNYLHSSLIIINRKKTFSIVLFIFQCNGSGKVCIYISFIFIKLIENIKLFLMTEIIFKMFGILSDKN